MTGVVATTVTRGLAPSRPSQDGNDLAGNSEAKSDRFRDLLSKLTPVAGSDGNGAGTAQQGEGQPQSSHPATGSWRFQLGLTRSAEAGAPPSGFDPAAAQPSVPLDIGRAEGKAGAAVPPVGGDSSREKVAPNPSIAELLHAAEAANAEGDDETSSQEHPDPALKDRLDAGNDTPVPLPIDRGQTTSSAISSQPTAAGSPIVLNTGAAAETHVEAEVSGPSGERARGPVATIAQPIPEATPEPGSERDATEPSAARLPIREGTAFPEADKAAAKGEDVAPMRPTQLAVLRSETHFAPVPQSSPMLQIVDRIKSEIGSEPAFAPALAERGLTYAQPSSEPVLKILHIHLEPADLGAVTVRMSLKDDALELRLDVSQQATAHVIQKDHETLSTALRSAGYLVDGVAVQVVEPDRAQASSTSSGPQGQQPSLQSSAQSASDGSQANAGSGRDQSPARGQDRTSPAQQDTHQNGSRSPGSAGGVYV